MTEPLETDWPLMLRRDHPELDLLAGTRLFVRPQATAEPGDVAVVKVARGEFSLRRWPSTDGPVAGVVLWRMEPVA